MVGRLALGEAAEPRGLMEQSASQPAKEESICRASSLRIHAILVLYFFISFFSSVCSLAQFYFLVTSHAIMQSNATGPGLQRTTKKEKNKKKMMQIGRASGERQKQKKLKKLEYLPFSVREASRDR